MMHRTVNNHVLWRTARLHPFTGGGVERLADGNRVLISHLHSEVGSKLPDIGLETGVLLGRLVVIRSI
jgi:hypothetical protein